jgi:hypothetical protein
LFVFIRTGDEVPDGTGSDAAKTPPPDGPGDALASAEIEDCVVLLGRRATGSPRHRQGARSAGHVDTVVSGDSRVVSAAKRIAKRGE